MTYVRAAASTQLSQITVRFCNNNELTPKLDLNFEKNERKNICVMLKNEGQENVTLRLNFVDGVMTNDNKAACKREDEDKTGFARYISLKKMEDGSGSTLGEVGETDDKDKKPYQGVDITLNAGQTVYKTFPVKFPGNVAGKLFGCLTTYIKGSEEQKSGANLTILVRRGNTMSAVVKGEIKVGLELADSAGYVSDRVIGAEILSSTDNNVEKKIVVYRTIDGENKVEMSAKNMGNVELKIDFNGEINHAWGYKVPLVSTVNIMPGDTRQVSFNIGDLPIYKQLFNVDMNIKYEPIIDFPTDDMNHALLEAKYEHISTSFFVFPWEVAVVALTIIVTLGLFFFLRKRRKDKLTLARLEYTVQTHETLLSIGEKFACGWKLLASANNLKPPYEIKAGDVIIVFDFRPHHAESKAVA